MSIQSGWLVRRMPVAAIVAAAMALATARSVSSDEASADHAQHAHGGEHAHHAQMMSRTGYERTQHSYVVPDVALTDQNGRRVELRTALADPKPVILNFIFTTCTTICPVLSASLAQMQRSLGPEANGVRMISISIDPDHDVPAKLRDYAQRFHAGEGWQFLTGARADILAAQRAFDAYRGDKTNHIPLTFMHFEPEGPWIRLDGFASAEELVGEYRRGKVGGSSDAT